MSEDESDLDRQIAELLDSTERQLHEARQKLLRRLHASEDEQLRSTTLARVAMCGLIIQALKAARRLPLGGGRPSTDHLDRRRPRGPDPAPAPVGPRNPSHLSGGAAAQAPRD